MSSFLILETRFRRNFYCGLVILALLLVCMKIGLAQATQYESMMDQIMKAEKLKKNFRLEERGLLFSKRYGYVCDDDYIAYSSNGLLLATCGGDSQSYLVDPKTGNVISKLDVARGTLNASFSPDSKLLATASMKVQVWDLASKKLKYSLSGHDNPVYNLLFNRNGRYLASIGWDARINLWDMKTGWHVWETQLPKFTMRDPEETVAAFTVDGKSLVYYNAKTVFFISTKTGEIRRRYDLHAEGKGSSNIAISPDGRWIAETKEDNTVDVYEAQSGNLHLNLKGHQLWVYALTYTHDSNVLLTGGSDMYVAAWDLRNGGLIVAWMVGNPDDSWPASLVVGPGNRFVGLRAGKVLRVWDTNKIPPPTAQ